MGVSQLAEPRSVFPFVVGCPRSGTTLLQAMLDGHPELAMPPESHFILPLAKRFANRWFAGPATNEAFADALLARRRFDYWSMTRDELLEALGEAGPPTIRAPSEPSMRPAPSASASPPTPTRRRATSDIGRPSPRSSPSPGSST